MIEVTTEYKDGVWVFVQHVVKKIDIKDDSLNYIPGNCALADYRVQKLTYSALREEEC